LDKTQKMKNSLEITELSTISPQIDLKLPPSQLFQDSFEKSSTLTWKTIKQISNSPQLFINGTEVGDVIQYKKNFLYSEVLLVIVGFLELFPC
jgi:hypothetical protein